MDVDQGLKTRRSRHLSALHMFASARLGSVIESDRTHETGRPGTAMYSWEWAFHWGFSVCGTPPAVQSSLKPGIELHQECALCQGDANDVLKQWVPVIPE